MKYHLAKIPGHDVGPCKVVTPEIMREAHDSINENDRKKDKAITNKIELAAGGVERSLGISIAEPSGRGSSSTLGRASSFFVP